ncbi:hypothetical protein [Magnetospirillum sulfuroxidans]|uniref:Uncharacterized protein n=1 Tax=Magnetospirillum sulfuroxidans TaxID=611300 RepID=A0ABS5ICT3_9PROT|nr:hypothetical protein [Magnetospirillum sulfuroxidans]MBR9972139.1 hypothetical protein [Magnetospirillum sulfuroxidans]
MPALGNSNPRSVIDAVDMTGLTLAAMSSPAIDQLHRRIARLCQCLRLRMN